VRVPIININVRMVEIEEIKTHIRKHKIAYSISGTALTAGAIGVISGAVLTGGGIQIVDAFKLINWKCSHTSVNYLAPRGCPVAIPVMCMETGESFASIRRAAVVNNISFGKLAQHIKGMHENVNGLHFKPLSDLA
jgi:hypothetical protein